MSKSPKHRALGNALRDARERNDLQLRELAALLGCHSGVLSRYETGDSLPKVDEVGRILGKLGVDGPRYKEIVRLAYDVNSANWVSTEFQEQREKLAALADIERQAKRITEVAPTLIPGLLQTAEYVRAIHRCLPDDEAHARSAIRWERQRVLSHKRTARCVSLAAATTTSSA